MNRRFSFFYHKKNAWSSENDVPDTYIGVAEEGEVWGELKYKLIDGHYEEVCYPQAVPVVNIMNPTAHMTLPNPKRYPEDEKWYCMVCMPTPSKDCQKWCEGYN